MKFLICSFLLLVVGTLAEERVKRQATYTFPGPRSDRSYRPQAEPAPVYAEERDDEESYQAPRRQYQAQPAQQYVPQQRAPVAPQPPPVAYEAPRPAVQAQRAAEAPSRRRAAQSTSGRGANKYTPAPQQSLGNNHDEEEEEEQGPDPLTLLLQDSQFGCGGKTDGYYADDSVNCKVFHYCVGGAKHSWMCPENTVFHQVHLNCVPDDQDICSQTQKFHFVNDYLYKAVDYEGPNKTARYSQRYYPEGYVVGDALVAPAQDHSSRRPESPQPQDPRRPVSHQQQAPRPQARQVAPPAPQPTYRAPQQQSRPAPRPSRPLESYPVEESPQGYNRAPPVRPASPQPQHQSYPREAQPQREPQSTYPREAAPQSYPREQPPPVYRVVPPQQAAQPQAPPQQVYRVVPPQQPASSAHSSEENAYQPQSPPQHSRRPVAPQQRPQAAPYAPPRQQYRATARSAGAYQPYAPSQPVSGVQYDEEY
ncbi:hypothetical protein JTE90_009964 [Oedothorax gibbosus]|uniref:Chitin-binding type-2 domain-containing protein n=1 Tax=Oedothorax gibbosus TaxID=931172 RepID=A0AAV6V7Z7_9ARAC|nr:hypothetical protein JTE90_009964 [Oedothorax gibbosus]